MVINRALPALGFHELNSRKSYTRLNTNKNPVYVRHLSHNMFSISTITFISIYFNTSYIHWKKWTDRNLNGLIYPFRSSFITQNAESAVPTRKVDFQTVLQQKMHGNTTYLQNSNRFDLISRSEFNIAWLFHKDRA